MSECLSVEIESLVGLVIDEVIGLEKQSDKVEIKTKCGKSAFFYHSQDCCESVDLNDFEFSGVSFEGAKILSAEISTNQGDEDSDNKPCEYSESFTWSFYKIKTDKGELWMRWLGESNGYYSESVDFVLLNRDQAEDFQDYKWYIPPQDN